MYDGVVFLDNNLQITLWNNGAERLTGIDGAAVYQRPFKPSLFRLSDEHGARFSDANCPIAHALHTGSQSLIRAQVRGRNDDDVVVDAHIMPVVGSDGTIQGVTLVLHDASPETSLEERCQRLHEKAIRDPLTQVANRAEFDRVHGIFVETHLQRGLPCSLIICDIDHFKRVNDNYGHPAGDEVIKSFAQLLKSKCRSGDLVARYGGEEFVMLCADCGVATAFERAEQVGDLQHSGGEDDRSGQQEGEPDRVLARQATEHAGHGDGATPADRPVPRAVRHDFPFLPARYGPCRLINVRAEFATQRRVHLWHVIEPAPDTPADTLQVSTLTLAMPDKTSQVTDFLFPGVTDIYSGGVSITSWSTFSTASSPAA